MPAKTFFVRSGAMALLTALAFTLTQSEVAAQDSAMRTIDLEMYLDLESVSNPQIAPDGSEIVYTRGWVDKMNDRRESSIWIMNADGSNPQRVTFRGSHNQTPAWCPDPNRPLIAFTGRANGLDIFTVNVQTQSYVRVTQGNGANKDPAFSPDCRMLAYSSTRQGGGVYISSPFGFNPNRVLEGAAETIRWSR